MATKRDLTVKPLQASTQAVRRLFPDGYDLDQEALTLHHLINAVEVDVNDPMYPRYQTYTERLAQWTLLREQHRERAGAEPDVPVDQARKAAQMSALRSEDEDTMTLHTLEAMRLFLGATPQPGEFRYGVPGGRRAATALRQLFLASAQDNPYADFALCNVDERVSKIKAHIASLEKLHMHLLEQAKKRGLNYSVLGARTPQVVSLGYHSPYGYAISNLIVLFDYVVRIAKSTERRDLSSKKDVYQQLMTIKRECRSLFETTLQVARVLSNAHMRDLSRSDWLPTGDEAAAKRVEAAFKTLGPVPQDVFTGERSPRHSLRNERLSQSDRRMLQQLALKLDADPVADAQERLGAAEALPGADADELVS